ncbi:MAG: glycosyltransferase family A protein [Methylacidiphilales bacterium]|nr:glycosyltransferase family A protein [Candidatus Methylacidiphilales bacterium]
MSEVSILIPCHNAEPWIDRCVESALAQTHPDTEVLVMDDGSTDCSRELLRRFGGRIRVLEQERSGANQARNRLLSQAQGGWVQFLDADDELLPDKIALQLKEGVNTRADVLAGGVISEIWRCGKPQFREVCSVDANSDLIELWLAWRFPQTGGLLWRKEALIRIGGWKEDLPCCQDYEVVMRAIQQGLVLVPTSNAGAIYRLWSEETLSRKNVLQTLEMRTALSFSMRDWLAERGRATDKLQSALGRSLLEMSRTLARYDLNVAEEYYCAHQKEIKLLGPAAPWHYRLALGLLGFRRAEQLAAFYRHAS